MEHAARRRKREPHNQKPHRVTLDKRLTLPARHLYDVYKMVCGEKADGACWMTMKTLMEISDLSAGAITKARRLLQELGYITVKQRRRGGAVGKSLVVRVVNIWQFTDIDDHSTDGGLNESTDSCRTGVQSDTTKGLVARDATTTSHEMRRNNNQVNNNHSLRSTSTSSSSSSLKESQTTIGRLDASSESSPLGDIPSGGKNSSAEDKMNNRLNSCQRSGMQGLDLNSDKEKEPPPPATYDENAAKRLIDAVAKKLRILRRPRLEVWSADIAKFRRINQVSEEDFEDRLSWYITHIDDEFVPIVHSAKSFCDKIDQIGAARVRSSIPTKAQRKADDLQAQIERMRQKEAAKK